MIACDGHKKQKLTAGGYKKLYCSRQQVDSRSYTVVDSRWIQEAILYCSRQQVDTRSYTLVDSRWIQEAIL